MEINGIAHIFITAGNFDASRAFYCKLLPFLGLKVVADAPGIYYCVGARTGFGIEAPPPSSEGKRFVQGDVGLHHVCFRARERDDVDEAHHFLIGIGARIVHAPQQDNYAPGYYSVLFEDPDGTRLEINHVPGRGLLADGVKIGGVYREGLPP
jgi:catechol 2,3-dioxygenase-like lactoylglutathione lyase family enzyme